MPHNLYLHSSLVQTRKIGKTQEDIRHAIRWNNIDLAVALNLAFFVNAAILVVAAAVLFQWFLRSSRNPGCTPTVGPYKLGRPLHFSLSQSLCWRQDKARRSQAHAGQIIMEGYLNLRIPPWLRRISTRLLRLFQPYWSLAIMVNIPRAPYWFSVRSYFPYSFLSRLFP